MAHRRASFISASIDGTGVVVVADNWNNSTGSVVWGTLHWMASIDSREAGSVLAQVAVWNGRVAAGTGSGVTQIVGAGETISAGLGYVLAGVSRAGIGGASIVVVTDGSTIINVLAVTGAGVAGIYSADA